MPQSDVSAWLQFALQQMAAESYLHGISFANDADIITRLKLGNNNPLFNDPNSPTLSGKTRFEAKKTGTFYFFRQPDNRIMV